MIELPCVKPELYNYSPHQGRMLLLNQIDQYDLDKCNLQSSILIDEKSEFFNKENSMVPVWISFEYMAQSIAVLSGIAHNENGNKPKIGFIMAVRDFVSHSEGFSLGDKLSVFVEESFRDGDVAVFEGKVKIGEKVCSQAVLNVIENNQELVNKWKTEI